MLGRRKAGVGGRTSLLTGVELDRRRTDWRRRRRTRRRAGFTAALVAAAAAAAIMVILSTAGARSRPHPRHLVARSVSGAFAGGAGQLLSRLTTTTTQYSAASLQLAVDRVLGYTSYVRLAGNRRREVALTFDDGPGPYTPRILTVLERMDAPATFFVIGRWARAYPKLIARETRDGFEIGDHTETHPPMAALSPALQQSEVVDAATAIVTAGAPYPRLWRPPYGSFNSATLQILHQLRMLMVLWSADTSDYLRPGVKRIVYVAVSGAQPGAIILMHDGGGNRAETAAALPRIILLLRQRGYQLVTVSQLLADDPPPTGQPPPRSLSGLG